MSANTNESVHLQLYSTAPAPSRDYYGLTVTNTEVILNVWNVTHGPHVYPKRQKTTLDEFDEDKNIKEEIKRVFGQHVTEYVTYLARGERNIQYLPNKIFLAILRMLASKDIMHLSQTSKIFFELCNSNLVWKIIFRKRCHKGPTQFEKAQSDYIPWRELLKKKVGFTRSESKRPIREVLNGTVPTLIPINNSAQNKKQFNGKKIITNKINNVTCAKTLPIKTQNANVALVKTNNLQEKLKSEKYSTPFMKKSEINQKTRIDASNSTGNILKREPKIEISDMIKEMLNVVPCNTSKKSNFDSKALLNATKSTSALRKTTQKKEEQKTVRFDTNSILENSYKKIDTNNRQLNISKSANKLNGENTKSNIKLTLSTKQKLYVHSLFTK